MFCITFLPMVRFELHTSCSEVAALPTEPQPQPFWSGLKSCVSLSGGGSDPSGLTQEHIFLMGRCQTLFSLFSSFQHLTVNMLIK